MTDRERALRRLGEGDLLNAEDEDGPTRICLVTSVTATTILTRSITVQEIIEFDRSTGKARAPFDFIITSIEALPMDIQEIILGLDRKYGESKRRRAEDPTWRVPPGGSALSKEQIRALLFTDDFYKANPLSD